MEYSSNTWGLSCPEAINRLRLQQQLPDPIRVVQLKELITESAPEDELPNDPEAVGSLISLGHASIAASELNAFENFSLTRQSSYQMKHPYTTIDWDYTNPAINDMLCLCETMKLDAPAGSYQAALQFYALNQIMGKACPFQCSQCGPAFPWTAEEKEEDPDDEARFYLSDPVLEFELAEEYLLKLQKERNHQEYLEYLREEYAAGLMD